MKDLVHSISHHQKTIKLLKYFDAEENIFKFMKMEDMLTSVIFSRNFLAVADECLMHYENINQPNTFKSTDTKVVLDGKCGKPYPFIPPAVI